MFEDAKCKIIVYDKIELGTREKEKICK